MASEVVPEAGYPVALMQTCLAAGLLVATVVGVAVVSLYDISRSEFAVALVTVVVLGLFWGVLSVRRLRRSAARVLATAPTAASPPVSKDGYAVARGLVAAGVMGVVEILWIVVVSAWGIDDPSSSGGIVLGITLGSAISMAVRARDLCAWQAAHDMTVYTRRGAPTVAWTKAQTRGRLVLVARPPA